MSIVVVAPTSHNMVLRVGHEARAALETGDSVDGDLVVSLIHVDLLLDNLPRLAQAQEDAQSGAPTARNSSSPRR